MRRPLLALATLVCALIGPATIAAAPARAATVAGLSFDPTPVAPGGTLAPGTPVVLALRATDTGGHAAGDAAVWLSFGSDNGPDGGSASVGGTALTSSPQQFTTGRDGVVAVTYTTAQPFCGGGVCTAPYPTSGADTVTAAATSSGSGAVSDTYSYASPGSAGPDRYLFSPDPVAAPSTLAPGQQVPVTLTVQTAGGQPETAAPVYLALAAAGGGSVAVSAGACAGTQLSATPQVCTTDANGRIGLTYTAGPGPAPGAGTAPRGGVRDVITAQNGAGAAPTETGSDAYGYTPPVYALSPAPLAPDGALGSSQSVTAALVVTDTAGQPLATTPVYLSLSGGGSGAAPGGSGAGGSPVGTSAGGAPVGTATATGTPGATRTLGPTPAAFLTDAAGRILITYSTPPASPAGGTDTITAASGASAPATTAATSYTYAAAPFVFSPDPVAAPGAVGAGQTATVTLTVRSGDQPQPGGTVYLSFTAAPGGGRASVGGTALGPDPVPFTADGGGRVAIVYRAPAPEPASGTDVITAQDAASGPTRSAADRYTFAPAAGGSQGYWLVARDGGIFSFGAAGYHGSEGGARLNAPIVGMAAAPDGGGYWLVASDGGVFTFGGAGFFGSAGGVHLARPIVGMAPTPDGRGYWLVAADGGIFNYGDAAFHGSEGGASGTAAVVGMAATPDGGGYWMAGADGSVAAFGDARLYGSARGSHLNAPVVGIASTATGNGYWLVGADGGIFTFGDAFFFGSTGALRLQAPIVGMAPTANGAGYWFVASDGGVFRYGNAAFHGSMGGTRLVQPVVGMALG
ncbi:MAG TPA: hypothetical protein VFH50_07345 [Acidimicrobiales bacterium]|nr:hypothetical protein [Acidimicrobiales bacterium]